MGFDKSQVKRFKPFQKGAVVFGGDFGDEGKGKMVDILARKYKKAGYNILSIRGQGSGNAGHTVVVDGKKYDFHYLTSAGLSADIMLLGAGMLLDPIRVLAEAEKLPEEARTKILIDERATVSCNMDRAMDAWMENARSKVGKPVIGTTKSGVGPCTGWRANRDHITFADASKCKDGQELYNLFMKVPNVPDEVRDVMSIEYATKLLEAIHKLNVVNSQTVIAKCRNDGNWAVILEVSQAMGLDPLFGNSGHFTTSTPCSDIGAAAGCGLTMHDFPDGSYMILKAYRSKVGAGPFITKFSDAEENIANFIYDEVGERGVTTGRKRDLGWFDAVAVRMAYQRTGALNLVVNCMDVMGKIPGNTAKICYAYKHKETGEELYDLPYHLSEYDPVYMEDIPVQWDIKPGEKLPDGLKGYIEIIELLTGAKVKYIGVGPSSDDLIDLLPNQELKYYTP